MIKLKPLDNRPTPPSHNSGKPSIWNKVTENKIEYIPDPMSEEPVKVVKNKGGRPTKVDVAKEKAIRASIAIRHLVASKPSVKEIKEFIEARLEELSDN